MFEVGGNTANNAFQLAMQQCCVASCSNLLLVLLHLKIVDKPEQLCGFEKPDKTLNMCDFDKPDKAFASDLYLICIHSLSLSIPLRFIVTLFSVLLYTVLWLILFTVIKINNKNKIFLFLLCLIMYILLH